ncbi:MAG: cell division protein ZapA [Oscillospiraceae bacterium]|nr:cell division protein ZapA [Oscillospiraceae bacterium]
MAEKRKTILHVVGTQLSVISTMEEDRLQQLATQLNDHITAIMTTKPSASLLEAVMLTAISALDSMNRENEGGENLRAQVREYASEANRAVIAQGELKRENDRLKEEIARLRQQQGQMTL